jgi:hypothetical protein
MCSFTICTLPQISLGRSNQESEEDRAYCTYGRGEGVQGFGGKVRGIDGTLGSEWILGILAGGVVKWIHLAQDRDRWRALVNRVMNLRILAPRSWLVTLL